MKKNRTICLSEVKMESVLVSFHQKAAVCAGVAVQSVHTTEHTTIHHVVIVGHTFWLHVKIYL